uniref:Uncharacterized protein n=1 Tax=Strombidium inclinatum TaxID=197538 RepID=A0A7S3IWW4_9SPIT
MLIKTDRVIQGADLLFEVLDGLALLLEETLHGAAFLLEQEFQFFLLLLQSRDALALELELVPQVRNQRWVHARVGKQSAVHQESFSCWFGCWSLFLIDPQGWLYS